MSFETKLVNLINKIYKNCVFRDRNGLFRKYSLESRVKLIPNIYAKEVDGFRNYLVMCGESVSDMCTCLKEFIKLVEGTTIDVNDQQKDPNTISW